jgi:hypothetical protein
MLLYQRGTDWQDAPLATCAARIRALLPIELRAGWTLVERGLANSCREHEELPTVSWIAAHGARHGFRIPNVAERARGMGMGAYLHSLGQLGLDEFQMFNGQGNSFDRAAVALRRREGVARWLAGADLARHSYPDPRSVYSDYERLRREAVLAGLPARDFPYPADLQEALLRPRGAACPGPPLDSAAGGGRGGE